LLGLTLMRNLALLTLAFSLLNPIPSDAQGSQSTELPPKQDYSQEAFVIERQDSEMRFESDGTGRVQTTLRVRVQSEAGLRPWGQLVFGYNSVNEKIEISYVRVIKPDKSVITAPADAIQDLNPPILQIAPIYTDFRQKHVTVPSLRPGDILEYQVVRTIVTPYAPGQFWAQYEFQKNAITLDEQLEIDVPANRTLKLKDKPGMDPKASDENGRRIYRWTSSHLVREAENKDNTEKKSKKKKPEDQFPDVQLTTFATWEEVGRWYQSLEKDRRVPSAAVRAKAEELTKGLHSDLDKTEALYDYTAKNFRYVSLSLGLGRYQPHFSDDVFHNQYGDCKDKSTLLESLLTAAGIPAAPALINSYRKLDPDVPSPSQFDHVVTTAVVGKERLWMDTTTEIAPFRLLAYKLRKKQALLIPTDGPPHLEETPADPPVPDTEFLKIDGKLDDSGTLDANISYLIRGDWELVLRRTFRSIASTQWQQVIENMTNAQSLGKDVSEVKISDTDATREPFAVSYHLSKTNYVDWLKPKEQLKLPLIIFALAKFDPDDQADAEPLNLGPPTMRDYRIRIELPAKYKARAPLPVSLKRDYAEYEATYKLEGNVFTAERKLTLNQAELSPSRVEDYIAFRQAVATDLVQQLSLETTATNSPTIPSGMKADDLVKSGNTELKNGNYELAIDLFHRATAADPKNRDAWNDLGLAYLDSRQDEPAIAAFQKQIEVNAYDPYAYNNLGRVYLRQRNYDEAVKWFRKQIEIVPLDKYAHSNLGITYVDMHKYDEAVSELEQAISINPNDAHLNVTLAEAYLHIGQDEKAMTAFQKAVDISPTPAIWNDVAYQLARQKIHLDIARNYVESAIATSTAALRTISVDQLTLRNIGWTSSLAASWDTLGWVDFVSGDLPKARSYVSAAWQLGQRAVVADHLGQIYEKLGDKKEATRFYILALKTRNPDPEARDRLAKLVGNSAKADEVVSKYAEDLAQERTFKLTNPSKQSGTADFFVLLASGTSGTAVDGAKFISGKDNLKSFEAILRAAKFQQSIPDDSPVKILRRGTLSCPLSGYDCAIVLALPEDVRSVN
jgi:tetratricopeptide (TPR) repeat protein/transglutaminase-like putative cysteine protease